MVVVTACLSKMALPVKSHVRIVSVPHIYLGKGKRYRLRR